MNKDFDRYIGEKLCKIRKAQGLTQEQLAAKLQLAGWDITRSALAKIEVGQRHLYPDEIFKLKKVLGVNYEEIFE